MATRKQQEERRQREAERYEYPANVHPSVHGGTPLEPPSHKPAIRAPFACLVPQGGHYVVIEGDHLIDPVSQEMVVDHDTVKVSAPAMLQLAMRQLESAHKRGVHRILNPSRKPSAA